VFATSSLTGWNNDEIELAWLIQVFDQYTKSEAGRFWRLLFLDGHGSHITKPWLAFCNRNRLLLMQYPSHATHSLQALDVVMFKSLSSQYSMELKKEANQVTQALHHYQVQNDLLLSENQGLRESLATKKKNSKHDKKLHLSQESKDHGGAE
jgi:hypothetical protein